MVDDWSWLFEGHKPRGIPAPCIAGYANFIGSNVVNLANKMLGFRIFKIGTICQLRALNPHQFYFKIIEDLKFKVKIFASCVSFWFLYFQNSLCEHKFSMDHILWLIIPENWLTNNFWPYFQSNCIYFDIQ